MGNTYYVGLNMGNGDVKEVALNEQGEVLWKVVFPSLAALANPLMAGGIADPPPTVTIGDTEYWYGDYAHRLGDAVINDVTSDRLTHPYLLQVLARGALVEAKMGHLNGKTKMVCTSGLPPAHLNEQNAKLLSNHIRAARPYIDKGQLLITAEPLGAVYAALLDNFGNAVGDTALTQGKVLIVDSGLGTFDAGVVRSMVPVARDFHTWELGVVKAFNELRSRWSADTGRQFSLGDVISTVREGYFPIANQQWLRPDNWQGPFTRLGEEMAAKLREQWGRGLDMDSILIAGGGGEISPIVEVLQAAYPHATVLPDARFATALGYARRAAKEGHAQRKVVADE
jgi:hypothetical protein